MVLFPLSFFSRHHQAPLARKQTSHSKTITCKINPISSILINYPTFTCLESENQNLNPYFTCSFTSSAAHKPPKPQNSPKPLLPIKVHA
jgi:hypothetical protein